MQSIPFAITWDMLERGRWQLVAAALAANMLPFFLESAVLHAGPADPDDNFQLIMHVMLVQISMFIFGAALISIQGNLSQLYAAPIPTSKLVAWYLIPGMVLIALEFILSTLAMNAVFGLHWPIWGPALYAAVSLAAVQAALWQTDKIGWVVIFLWVVAGGLGLWYKLRHGPLFGQPSHYWEQVTVTEAFTLLAVGGAAYFAAIQGVARSRRGDTLRSFGIVDWINRVLDPAPEVGLPFRSPADAQLWYLWRQKGWAMPACVVFELVLGFVFWLFASRNPNDLWGGVLVIGGAMSIVGFIGGIVIGNCGPNDATFEIGNFLATRPMTTRQLSRIIINTTVQSVLWSWGIWATAAVGVYVVVLGVGITPQLDLPPGFLWWYLPVSILGPWVISGLGAALGLTGRNGFTMIVICGGLIITLGGKLLEELTLTDEAQQILDQAVIATLGVVFVLSTAGAYLAARRYSLIDASALYKAALVWLVLSVPVVVTGILRPALAAPVSGPVYVTGPMYLLAVGVMALVVAPIPLTPLALTWNRVR